MCYGKQLNGVPGCRGAGVPGCRGAGVPGGASTDDCLSVKHLSLEKRINYFL